MKLIKKMGIGLMIGMVLGFASSATAELPKKRQTISNSNQIAPEINLQKKNNSQVVVGGAGSLEKELQELEHSQVQPKGWAPSERLYAVQDRHMYLGNHIEVNAGGAWNFGVEDYVRSYDLNLGVRYYINNLWYLNGSGSFVFNEFSATGQRLISQNNLVPDVAFTKHRFDLLLGHNIFYGKIRTSKESVIYFDVFLALGPGYIITDLSNEIAAVAEIGFTTWFGRNFSVQISGKDYFHNEKRRTNEGTVNEFLLQIKTGILF